MDPASLSWAGVAALAFQVLYSGVALVRHFKLNSKCCGVESGINWDVTTTPDPKAEPLKIKTPTERYQTESEEK